MSNEIKLKRKTDADGAPTIGDLVPGELAVNAFSGRLFIEKSDPSDTIVEFIHDQGGQTIGGSLDVTGAFTSLGIDDNAASEQLGISNGFITFGGGAASIFNISQSVANQSLGISGSTSGNLGGNIRFWGNTAVPGSSIDFRADTNNWQTFTETTGQWQIRTGTGVKTTALTITNTQNATFTAAVNVLGNFTSLGIDDNAPGERLQLADFIVQLGANNDDEFAISRVLETGSLGIAGGSGKTGGGNIIFRGDSHATLAGDTTFRSGVNTWMNWDESGGDWYLYTGVGAKSLAVLITETQQAVFTGDVSVSGTFTSLGIDDNATAERLQLADTEMVLGAAGGDFSITQQNSAGVLAFQAGTFGSGGTVVLAGSSHATNPGDVELRSSGNNWQTWDESAGIWELLTGTGVKTAALTIAADQTATFSGNEFLLSPPTGVAQLNLESDTNTLLGWHDSGAAVDNRRMVMAMGAEVFNATLFSDDFGAGTEFMRVTRTLNVADTVEFITSDFQIIGPMLTFGLNAPTTIKHNIDTQSVIFSGGDAQGSGANIQFIGGSHGSLPNDMYFRGDTDTWMQWLDATGIWQVDTGVGALSPALTLAADQSATFYDKIFTSASTTARAGVSIPTGVAPSSPFQGDMWVTATDAFIRVDGVSQSIIAKGIQGLGIWKYRTETGTPPSSGQIRFDNANISAATEFYLHETNQASTDTSAALELLLQDGSILYVQDQTNADNHYIIEISSSTDNGTYRTYGIESVIEEGTEPGQNDNVILITGGSAAGGGTDLIPANNTWTGTNSFTGAFTSLGIDDNAAFVVLELLNGSIKIGTSGVDFSVAHTNNDRFMQYVGGDSGGSGGGMIAWGGTHSTQANDFRLRAGVNAVIDWDESAGELEIFSGSGSKTLALTIDSNQDLIRDGNVQLKMKVIDIGDWNMDTGATKTVAHGLTLADIRSVEGMIRSDNSIIQNPLHGGGSDSATPDPEAWVQDLSSTNVILRRKTSGDFDNAGYDSTSFNRGWITILYV